MGKKNFLKWIIFSIGAALTAVLAAGAIMNYVRDEGIRFVQGMGVGWNLGNTLDVYRVQDKGLSLQECETYWGNPATTKEMIDKISEAGFKTVRIPVSWGEHMDAQGVVDTQWMARVREVVDYVIENDMYAILDTHHEVWLSAAGEDMPAMEARLAFLWEQIADTFQEYDERLLYDGVNEPRARGTEEEWEGTPEYWKVVNSWNSVFLSTIRQSGGRNADRYVLISPYAGSTKKEVLEALTLPKDDKVIVTVHLYKPYAFAMEESGTPTWKSSDSEYTEELVRIFELLEKTFIDRHIPVIVGEIGCIDKNNTEDRAAWISYCIEELAKRRISAVWWDDGGNDEKGYRYSIFNRKTLKWIYPEITEALTGIDVN